MSLLFGALVPHPPILVPEIGGEETQKISKTLESMRRLARSIVEADPEIIAVITPHGRLFRDAFGSYVQPSFEGSFAPFRCPQVSFRFEGAPEVARRIAALCEGDGLPHTHPDESPVPLDHGVLVPLYFLAEAGYKGKILPLTYSLLDRASHWRFGEIIQESLEGRRAVILASGDLSHRLTKEAPAGFDPRGKEFDETLMELLGEHRYQDLLDLDEEWIEAAGECGYRSLLVLLGALGNLAQVETYSYEGPFGVGYGVAAFSSPTEFDPAGYARKVLAHHLERKDLPEAPGGFPKAMAGCFVSLKKEGELRGCIGTIMPVTPSIADEIRHNAIAAATEDPRFHPVAPEELDALSVSVDILSPLEVVSDLSQLDPRRYGVIVSSKGRRGLLLPDLEGIDTVEQQLGIAMRKAGIPGDTPIEVQRFRVTRYPEQSLL